MDGPPGFTVENGIAKSSAFIGVWPVTLVVTGFHRVSQVGLELLTSDDWPSKVLGLQA